MQFGHFLDLARPLQSSSHRRIGRRSNQRGMKMKVLSNYAQHAFAAASAVAISALLFANALATKTTEVHSIAGILA